MADSGLMKLAKDWCRKDDIPIGSALLLVGERGLDESTEALALALSKTIKHLVGVSRQEHQSITHLLCEFDQEVAEVVLPPSETFRVSVEGNEIKFCTHRLVDQPPKFKSRVMLKDSEKEPCVDEATKATLTKGSSKTHSQVLSSCSVSGGRKLRPFSGARVPSKDEDPFDTWIEVVTGQLEEEPDDAERRRRLREALRPPAANIITDLRSDQPQATAEEYLAALELAFGSTESPEELCFKFQSMHQQREEAPSEFLARLQAVLRKLVRKGGVKREKINSLLLDQFIKGILYTDILLVNLRLKDARNKPPPYLKLLQMVRREEAEQQEKLQQRADKPVETLSTTTTPKSAKSLSHYTEKKNYNRRVRPNFCYGCGEEGHYKGKCPNTPNFEKVNDKLIKFLQGNDKGHLTGSNQTPNTSQ
ncbi:paraneoplastic antigen Ma1 homolog [Asterias rubens]|uniref:paraneoplastic antigen Ma1 homolog n=1 Tax=Asterias rubens TaxID=7604 RepID=UPI00145531E0|nr:paraneoplastic antigen Ma1 homolog [Asterias rubens]